jgi:hypothetical protein
MIISYLAANTVGYAGLTIDVRIGTGCADNSFKTFRTHFVTKGTDTSRAYGIVNAIKCTGGT